MRKLLYLSYYYPPSGGPGVQRALKFSRYLPDAGWEPVVVTVDPRHAAYPSIDPTLLDEVPDRVEVRRTRSWDPYAAYARFRGSRKEAVVPGAFAGAGEPDWKERVARFIRANVFIPDARVGWVPFAKRELGSLAATGAFELILSSGPPHSTHLAARRVAGRFGLPWVADLRDPWTEIYYYDDLPMSSAARARDRRLERQVLASADALVVVTPSMRLRLVERGFDTPTTVITNGFDPADFRREPPVVDPWLIRHVGTLEHRRSVGMLAQALDAIDDDAAPFHVGFVGTTNVVVVEGFAARAGIRWTTEPTVNHETSVERMRSSGILLAVVHRSPNSDGIVPGKIFEYLAAGRPILCIGPPGGDAARMIRESGAGETFHWDDASGVAAWLSRYADSVRRGDVPRGADAQSIGEYARPAQARRLAALFDEVVATHHG